MTYLVLASILLVALYIGAAIWVRWISAYASASFAERLNAALPDSISAMVYELPQRWQWLWIVWMWTVSMLTCIPLINVLPENVKILGFTTMVCLVLCGAMPLSDSTVNHRAHNIFGTLGGVLSQVCVAIISPWWLMAWLPMAFIYAYDLLTFPDGCLYVSRWYDGKGVFLAEMICTAAVCDSLLSSI